MKVDCALYELRDDAVALVDTKSLLALRLDASGAQRALCCYLGEQRLGQLSSADTEAVCAQLCAAGHAAPASDADLPVRVAARTVKRHPETKAVLDVQARSWGRSGAAHVLSRPAARATPLPPRAPHRLTVRRCA